MTSIMPVNLEQNHPPSGPVPAALQDADLASSNNNERTGAQRKPAQEDEVAPKSVFAKFFNRKGTQKQTNTKKTKSTPDKVRDVKVLSSP
jgi:DNA modification methylase